MATLRGKLIFTGFSYRFLLPLPVYRTYKGIVVVPCELLPFHCFAQLLALKPA